MKNETYKQRIKELTEKSEALSQKITSLLQDAQEINTKSVTRAVKREAEALAALKRASHYLLLGPDRSSEYHFHLGQALGLASQL